MVLNAAKMAAMMVAIRMLIACLGLLLAVVASAAEAQFWIVLGSYQNPGNAEAARQASGMGATQPLQVRAFDTSGGRWHRLLLGPFEARSQAAGMLAEARGSGHADAWLLAGDGGEVLASADVSGLADDLALVADAGDGDEFEDWESFDPYGDLGEFDGLEDLPPLPEADVHLLSEQHKRPVSEPPPGYQLHKLRRGGSEL